MHSLLATKNLSVLYSARISLIVISTLWRANVLGLSTKIKIIQDRTVQILQVVTVVFTITSRHRLVRLVEICRMVKTRNRKWIEIGCLCRERSTCLDLVGLGADPCIACQLLVLFLLTVWSADCSLGSAMEWFTKTAWCITCSAVAQQCVKAPYAKSMEKAKIRLP